jgi:hypothetical protein
LHLIWWLSEKGQPLPIFWTKFRGVIPSRTGIRMIAGMNLNRFDLRNILRLFFGHLYIIKQLSMKKPAGALRKIRALPDDFFFLDLPAFPLTGILKALGGRHSESCCDLTQETCQSLSNHGKSFRRFLRGPFRPASDNSKRIKTVRSGYVLSNHRYPPE